MKISNIKLIGARIIATPPISPLDIVFDETWESCTPGLYTAAPITGCDESGWTIDEGGALHGVEVPNPASTYVTARGEGGEVYFAHASVGADSTHNVYTFWYRIPTAASGAQSLQTWIYNASADECALNMDINDEDEIYVLGAAGSPFDSGAGRDTWFKVVVTVHYVGKTFDIDINDGAAIENGIAWADGTGTDGDMNRLGFYIQGGATNNKDLGRVSVANGEV